MRVLKADTYRRMPWKNGQGFTTEVAVFPENADLAGFGWRISMATVAADGPFSTFPDIDRTLSIIEGDGVDLVINGAAPVRLSTTSSPLAFAADADTHARLVGSAIEDLNVMTRRGVFLHRVERIAIADAMSVITGEGNTILLAMGDLSVAAKGRVVTLSRLDCLLFETAETPVILNVSSPVEIYRIDIVPALGGAVNS